MQQFITNIPLDFDPSALGLTDETATLSQVFGSPSLADHLRQIKILL
jgi:hypothetical protein